MMVDWRGILLASIPIFLLAATLRLRDRYRSRIDPSAFEADDAIERGPTRREVSAFRLLMMLPLAAVFWALFDFLGNEQSSPRFSAPFSAHVGSWIWALPAFFASLIAGSLSQDAYFRWMYRDAYRLPGEPGHSAQKLAEPRRELVLGGCMASFLALQLHNAYVVFSPTEIRIGPVLAWKERVYSYDDVESVRFAPRFVGLIGSRIHDRAMMGIEFRDGEDWNTDWYPADLSDRQVEALAVYVAERAGKAVERIEVYGRSDAEVERRWTLRKVRPDAPEANAPDPPP